MTKFCDPIPSPDPGKTEPVREDKLPDMKADPMKDTEGAVVTLELVISDISMHAKVQWEISMVEQ